MPFRRAIFDAAISVSALQWLAAEDALRCFQSLREVLVRDARAVFQEPTAPRASPNSSDCTTSTWRATERARRDEAILGRTRAQRVRTECVPQVYPRDPRHAEAMVLAAKEAGFTAQLVVACAHICAGTAHTETETGHICAGTAHATMRTSTRAEGFRSAVTPVAESEYALPYSPVLTGHTAHSSRTRPLITVSDPIDRSRRTVRSYPHRPKKAWHVWRKKFFLVMSCAARLPFVR